jgi:hypothetical protein
LRPPSLRTGLADLPHPALRLLVLPRRGLREGLGSRSQAEILMHLKPQWLRLATEVLQHACCHGGPLRPQDVSCLFNPKGHSQGESLNPAQHHTSTFLHPLAPQALLRFFATMRALTPAQGVLRALCQRNERPPFPVQVSLVHTAQSSRHSLTNHPTRSVIAFLLPTQRYKLVEPIMEALVKILSTSQK